MGKDREFEFEITTGEDEFERRQGRNMGKIFWGLLFVVGAIAFLANKMGLLGGIPFWPVVLSVVLIVVLINGIVKRSFGQMLFCVAFLIIVNDKWLGLEAITPWPVLFAALALTIGLNMLFPGKKRHVVFQMNGNRKGINNESREGGVLSYENTFGGTVKYIAGEVSAVKVENTFGSTEIYFSDAILKDGCARVFVENSFGAVTLYIPSHWQVIMNVDTAFGGAEEKGRCNPTGENTLYVDGDISFGGLEIKYI